MSRSITPISRDVVNATGSSYPDPSMNSVQPSGFKTSSRPVSYLASNPTSPVATREGDLQDSALLSAPGQPHDEAATEAPVLPRSNSHMSHMSTQSQAASVLPSRGGTLKKKASLHKSNSLRRTPSRRSSYAGSVRSMQLGEKEKYAETPESNSVFYCPVPTSGNPTELLANRFQAWRKVLQDLINYFRELHKNYETRAKTLLATSNVINNSTMPSNFLASGGLGEAAHVLRDFHKQAIVEANKARDLDNEVIMQLTGLRSDLKQKIKEIKSLAGDFKNSVDKEQEQTKRAVRQFQEALGMVDHDAAASSGKGDPFLVKMGVDRQLEKQIDEENYLHRAYLNLEASGRELESIVVGEIQKAYNVLASILRREADEAYDVAEKLKEGPLSMTKDHEWDEFVTNNSQMVDPRNPVRQVSHITYPGKEHPAAIEVRSGMLERKSKYLKNYTPGWYILSPTHLHEFKSADRIPYQNPVMSLYLPEQKLGTHSDPGSSSHKFMLKGRQTGSMHRGHAWVFRAETYDTMLAWYGDVKELTEKRGEERNDFVRRTHARSLSGNSLRAGSIHSSDGGIGDDEADQVPFSGEQSIRGNSVTQDAAMTSAGGIGVAALAENEDSRSEAGWRPPQQRPAPGGRFPSDVNVTRGLHAPLSPSSGDSSDRDRDIIAAAGGLPGSGVPFSQTTQPHTELQQPAMAIESTGHLGNADGRPASSLYTTGEPHYTSGQHHNIISAPHTGADTTSNYGEWMAPIAAGAGGAAVGAAVMHHNQEQQQFDSAAAQPAAAQNVKQQMDGASAIPAYGESSAPIPVASAAPVGAPSAPRAMSDDTTTPSSNFGLTTSSQGTTATLSTVPTNTAYPSGTDNMVDTNGGFVVPRTTTTEAPTSYATKPNTERQKSQATISDLHVPGEFPRAASNEQAQIYQDIIQH